MNRTFTSNTNSLNWEGELGSNANLEIFSHLHEATLFLGLRLHKESLCELGSRAGLHKDSLCEPGKVFARIPREDP